MNINDFTTAERIIASVTSTVGDSEFKNGFSKGWYMSHVQQALQDISIESKWLKVIKDYAVPQKLQIAMPKGVFDLREIYLYNGSLCNPNTTQVVHWKRTFNNMPDGQGYTARIKDDGSNPGDIFLPNQSYRNTSQYENYARTKYYFNITNGIIMLSSDCASYPYIRLIFNGMGGEIGDEPVIPRFFERAIMDYVEERFYNAMKARKPRTYRILWADIKQQLDSPIGAWRTAIKRVKAMDQSEKESLNEYISSQFHK